MQVSPFAFEPDGPGDEPGDTDAGAEVRASPDAAGDDQPEETIEEPGYGHGV